MNNTEKNRSQYDTTFKDLFGQPPQQLLQLLIGRSAVQMLPVEFASTQKRLPDLVFQMADDSIFHLELQGRPEEMKWRMLMYYPLIRQRYPGKILLQMVLYVGQEEWHPRSAIEEENLSFRYTMVDIRSIDCRALLASPVLEENILAILCRMDNQEGVIREILYRISALPTKARADALTKLVILSRLRKLEIVVKTEAEEMALTFDVMENDVLRPLFMKAQMESEQKGRLDGLRDGLRDGQRDGRREEATTMLLKLLRRKFGQMPEWATTKISSANLELLENWGENILFAQSLEDVFAS
ncbi:MAG: DUF4351 domain-containing protein [Magnetococcales bacterium]|nr:DUF4351 domain-containing protein [Magnetococcales bacterium]